MDATAGTTASAADVTQTAAAPSCLTVTNQVSVGSEPLGVALNPKTGLLYVADSGANAVTVINGRTDKVTVTVMAGTAPSTPSGLAVDPAANAIYVTNQFNNTLSVFGGRTDKVTATVGVGTKSLVGPKRLRVRQWRFECTARAGPLLWADLLTAAQGVLGGRHAAG